MRLRPLTAWLSRSALCTGMVALLAAGGCMAGAVHASGGSGGQAGSAGSGGSTARGGNLGSGGVSSPGSGGAASGAGGFYSGTDAAVDADADCAHLNIGILGNPGSNPSSNFQVWLEARGTTVQRIQTTADVPLTAADLAV